MIELLALFIGVALTVAFPFALVCLFTRGEAFYDLVVYPFYRKMPCSKCKHYYYDREMRRRFYYCRESELHRCSSKGKGRWDKVSAEYETKASMECEYARNDNRYCRPSRR